VIGCIDIPLLPDGPPTGFSHERPEFAAARPPAALQIDCVDIDGSIIIEDKVGQCAS